MKHYGDITKLSGWTLPIVDVITGGSPCQDLSVAGKRAGLDGERSGLFMEQIRIVKEMRERDRRENGRTGYLCRPRFMVWENVPGAFSSNKGRDFQAVLTEIARIAEPETPDVPMPEKGGWSKSGILLGDGFSISWRLHDAQFWGVPQRRKRIALVADFGGHSAPEVLFERQGLSGNPQPGETQREEAAEASGGGVDPAEPIRSRQRLHRIVRTFALQRSDEHKESDQAHTLSARDYKDATDLVVMNAPIAHALKAKANSDHREDSETYVCQESVVRRLTPMECERLQGFPDGWTDIGDWMDGKGKKHKAADGPRYKAIGNSIALPFWFWLLRRISAQYERPATLGSLFDGIGGFPLCWERCNGKGTAIWASEIEPFPIAVTKKHFPEEEIE